MYHLIVYRYNSTGIDETQNPTEPKRLSEATPTSVIPREANRNTLWAAVLAEELCRGGIREVCLAPGSRSAPLVLAFAQQPALRLHTLLDERSMGFFGLGLARASGEPVVLLCTSGTAAANLHPAILEAHHGEVPLLALTADRPFSLREVGAAQSIDQHRLYGAALRWFFDPGEPRMDVSSLKRLRVSVAQALAAARGPPAGPVQLNLPFRKPLEAQAVPEDLPAALRKDDFAMHGLAQPQPLPFAHRWRPLPQAHPELLEQLAQRIVHAPRGLILCGPMPPYPAETFAETSPGPDALLLAQRRFARALSELAQWCGYPILADPPSGLWADPALSPGLPYHEALLRCARFRKGLSPQLILRFGAPNIAPHVAQLLEEQAQCPLVLVHPAGNWGNPYPNPTEVIPAVETSFCTALLEVLRRGSWASPRSGLWVEAFSQAHAIAATAIQEAFSAPPPQGREWFEGRVFHALAPLLPPRSAWFTANSMPVRDLNAFVGAQAQGVLHCVNRGVNGIDGTLSSALGIARARAPQASLAICGDIAFHHDSNGLQYAQVDPPPLTIVLLNNGGGGIFAMLPIARYGAVYERYFATPQEIDFAALCRAYQIPHHQPQDWDALQRCAQATLRSGRTEVIEIRTLTREANVLQHAKLWRMVSERIEAALDAGTLPSSDPSATGASS